MPRKNVRLLGGKPLLAYTIEAAQNSRSIGHLVVTTDDDEVARIARSYGCEAHRRPEELASDSTPMVPVVLDAIDSVHNAAKIDVVLVLQPTSPFRSTEDIDQALAALQASDADSIVSVRAVGDCHPSRMYRLRGDRLIPMRDEPASRLRQDLEPLYHRNGAIYACRLELLTKQGTLTGATPLAYLMPAERSLNIDDRIDWITARALVELTANEGLE